MLLSRRLSVISFAFLVITAAACAIFVHQVSPLRDATFVSESDWLHGATVLAALLSSGLLLVLRPYGLRKIAACLSRSKWIFVGVSLCLCGLIFGGFGQYLLLTDLPLPIGTLVFMGSYMSLFAVIAGFYAAFTLWLQNRLENSDRGTRISGKVKQVLQSMHWIGLGSFFFVQIWLVFFVYLLEQFLID
jgi:hypothetical protein